jgi:hypothetical protein
MQETTPSELSITSEQAKVKVFEHWDHLNSLAEQRFPKDENLAHEALLYVLKGLEADEWKRVRTWRGLGHFLPFITLLAARLLIDFSRTKFGYIRKPIWLAEKGDPLWEAAYRLLMVEKCSRHEAIEQLLLSAPQRERWSIEEVVTTLRKRCQEEPGYLDLSAEAQVEPIDEGSSPDELLRLQDKEMLEALWAYLQADDGLAITPRVAEIITRLRAYLRLTEEDRLLLKLYYQDGIKIKVIVKLLNLQGDPYKRIKKIITQIQKACQKAGLLLGEA